MINCVNNNTGFYNPLRNVSYSFVIASCVYLYLIEEELSKVSCTKFLSVSKLKLSEQEKVSPFQINERTVKLH